MANNLRRYFSIFLRQRVRENNPPKNNGPDINNILLNRWRGTELIAEDNDQDSITISFVGGTENVVRPVTDRSSLVFIVYVLILAINVVLLVSTIGIYLAITFACFTAGQSSQTRGQSEVCIDDVSTNWHTPKTEHLYQKLKKRTPNGVPQVCAETQDQLSTLMELATRLMAVQSEIYAPHENSQTFTPVSAHKLLQAPDTEFNNKEPTVVRNKTDYARLNPNTNSHIEHSSGVAVTKNSLLIQFPGLYYVYVGVHFKPKSDRTVRDFEHKSWIVYVYRENGNSPHRNTRLLQMAYTVCDNCSRNEKSSFAGGSFYMEAGDHIYVSYELLGVLKFNTKSTFLGLMMVDN